MQVDLDILDQQDKIPVTEALEKMLGEIVRVCWQFEARAGSPEVSVVLCDNAFIRELNRNYRHIDEPTDVLSFPQEDTHGEGQMGVTLPLDDDGTVILGDVVISLERAMEQAGTYGHSFEREVGYLLAHGLLHLLGMDHNTEEERKGMRKREERILAQVQLAR
jgi:probable rRNA maturation factor